MIKILFLLSLACLNPISPLYAAESQLSESHRPGYLGERLRYKITWLKIPVGTGDLWVKEKMTLHGREVIHVVGTIETNKVLSKIFPVHDEAHTWMDAETFESVQFEKKIDELIINTHEKTVFDGKNRKGYFESFKTGEKREFKIQLPVHDVLTAFFWARRQRLEVGESAQTGLTADQKDWLLKIEVKRWEKVKVDGIKINTLRVEPTSFVEGEVKKDKAYFNLTPDSLRTPVRVVYKAPFGKMVGTLIVHTPESGEKKAGL